MKKSFLAVAAVAAAVGLPALSQAATVVRDAATGQMRAPTAAEAAALRASRPAAASAKAAAEPMVRKMPNGSRMVEVPESLMQYSVVTRAADGTLVQSCVQGDDQALQSISKPQFAKPLSMSTARTARGMAYEVR